MHKEISDGIVVNSETMVGKPLIKGTRIPVGLIVKLLAQGITIEEILKDYSQLKREDIIAALEYVSKIVNGEEVFQFEN